MTEKRSLWAALPRRFRKFFFWWASAMLTLMFTGYALYIFRGQWTPDHLTDWLKLPVLGGL